MMNYDHFGLIGLTMCEAFCLSDLVYSDVQLTYSHLPTDQQITDYNSVNRIPSVKKPFWWPYKQRNFLIDRVNHVWSRLPVRFCVFRSPAQKEPLSSGLQAHCILYNIHWTLYRIHSTDSNIEQFLCKLYQVFWAKILDYITLLRIFLIY